MKPGTLFYGLKSSYDIKKRYRRLAQQLHPDKPDTGSQEKMNALQTEYRKAMKDALRGEGKSDSEIDGIMTEENMGLAHEFMEKAIKHPGGILGMINSMSDQVAKQLIEDADNGIEISGTSGFDKAMKMVFGKNIFTSGQKQPDQLPSGDPLPKEKDDQDK